MKTILSLTLATSLLAGMASIAAAQEAAAPAQGQEMQQDESQWGHHGGKHGGKRGGHHGKRGHGMMNVDGNGDGFVSDAEAATLAGFAFNRLDRDGSDSISETEFTTGGHRHRSWASWFGTQTAEDAAVLKLRQEKFAKIDGDKNAVVDKAEFMTDFKNRFMAADTDKDGKVSVWEFQLQK